jgi:hypothetical protein
MMHFMTADRKSIIFSAKLLQHLPAIQATECINIKGIVSQASEFDLALIDTKPAPKTLGCLNIAPH